MSSGLTPSSASRLQVRIVSSSCQFPSSERQGSSTRYLSSDSFIGNGMSEALTLAIYILCCRELGKPPLFPGNQYLWNSVDDSSSAISLADMSIWAATNNHTRNEDFNRTNGDVFVWKYFWPKLAKYFGVEVSQVHVFLTPAAPANWNLTFLYPVLAFHLFFGADIPARFATYRFQKTLILSRQRQMAQTSACPTASA